MDNYYHKLPILDGKKGVKYLEDVYEEPVVKRQNSKILSTYDESFLEIKNFLFAFFDDKETLEFIIDASTCVPFTHRKIFHKYLNISMLKPECVYGVLGPRQLEYFESLLNREVKVFRLVDVLQYDVRPDMYSICHNERHALFHSARIRMFLDLVYESYSTQLVYNWKDNRLVSLGDMFKKEDSNDVCLRDLYEDIYEEDFKAFAFVFMDDEKILISNVQDRATMTVDDLVTGKKLLNYLSHHVKNGGIRRPVYAVMNEDQERNFWSLMRSSSMSFVDYSKYLIPEMDYVCQNEKDVEFHVRRINLIQDLISLIK